jgi:hypothetical protein
MSKYAYNTLPPFMIKGALQRIVDTGDIKSARIARETLEGPESEYAAKSLAKLTR